MLVRLYGRNFRCLKGDFELSMLAADLKRDEDRNRGVIELDISGLTEPLRLLRVVGLFGPNASGKSTVLTAASALNWLATKSSHASPDGPIPPYEPFLLDEQTAKAPITLGCDLVYKSSLLRYELRYAKDSIESETLSTTKDDTTLLLIDRKPDEPVGGSLIEKSDANRLYVKEMQPRVTVLSKLAHHGPQRGPESARPYFVAVRNATAYADYSSAAEPVFGRKADERFVDDETYRDWIMKHLIQTADFGICSVQARRDAIEVPEFIREVAKKHNVPTPEKEVIVSFLHSGSSVQPIDFMDESSGTKKLFAIASDWWRLAHDPITLLSDELSASLHTTLLDRLIRSVNDAPLGAMKSQLIFTTHDLSLLEGHDGLPPALRRDQVYFTKKDSNGASTLYSLAEFKDDARPVHNLRKRYLSGLYGALPSVERVSL